MPIQVFVADEQSDRPVEADRVADLARQVLEARGVLPPAELNVLFVDEETIAALNRRFLGHDGPTDVLSFPIEDEVLGAPPPGSPPPRAVGPGREGGPRPGVEPRWDEPRWDEPSSDGTGGGGFDPGDGMPLLVGDVVICPEIAYRNAPGHAGSYDDELALLLVHGILHLLGMDHERGDEAAEMEALEHELLARYHLGTRP